MSSISLVAAIIVEICCCGVLKNILFAIFTGLFGSGMVTVFIYGTEYSVLRRKTLETYWQTAFDINKRFGSIRVMYFGDSIDQVKERLSKLHNRKEGICLRADYKRDKELESHIEDYWQIENYRNHAIEVMRDYISVTDKAIQELENAYGNIYFFWNNKKRQWIYDSIHMPLRDMYREVKSDAICHFIPYLNGNHHNLAAMIGIVEKLQERMFEVRSKEEACEDGNMITLSYYNKFHHDLDEKIEEFRADVIYHCEKEESEFVAQMIATQHWDKKIEEKE